MYTTIQDVAREANVSVATVSRVINNSRSVSPATKDRVEAAIKKLNYQPNLLGRNLRRSETRMVLALLQNISNPFYSRVVRGIEDLGRERNYHVMICNTDSDIARERVFLDLLKNKLVDGVIFMAPELTGQELTEIGKSFPVVQCCEYKEDALVSRVSIDNVSASYRAVNHLINLGHRRIGMISADTGLLSAAHREMGYKKALEDANIEYDPQLMKYGNYGYKGGLRTARELLQMENRPTAIFAISDIMAIGVIKSAREMGLKVPEDLAVVGFDDTSIAAMYDPQLTTVSQPRYDLGYEGMKLLLRRIEEQDRDTVAMVLEHELIIRESTVK